MAPQVFTDFVSLICAHPIISGMTLILFTPPFFPIVKFFSPLLISTALFMLALFTMGPKVGRNASQAEGDEEWEDKTMTDGESVSRRWKPDGSWKDWVKSIEESSLAFMSPRAKLKRENWKGGVVNDETVSILEDASWAKGADFSSYEQGDSGITQEEGVEESLGNSFMPTLIAPSMLFKVDSGLQAAAERSIYDDMDLGEDAPELEDVEELDQPATPAAPSQQSTSHGILRQPMENLQIPKRATSEISETDSPSTDLDSSSNLDRSKRFMFANVRKNSANSNSDADTPVAEKLSLSGKLNQMENLGDFIDDSEHAEKTGQESPELNILQPTTEEQVQSMKDQIESFVQEEQTKEEEGSVIPSPPKPENVAENSVSKLEETPATKPAELPAPVPKGEISEVQ